MKWLLSLLLLAYLAALALVLTGKERITLKKSHFSMILGSVLGASVAVLVYVLLYFSVATISHTHEYSAYGYEFAKFYRPIFYYAHIIIMIVLTIFFALSVMMKNSIFWTINLAYQAALVVFLIVPDEGLAYLFDWVGLIDFSISYFATQHGIPISEMTIKKDLIHTQYSLVSYSKIVGFYGLNAGLVVLMIVKMVRKKSA